MIENKRTLTFKVAAQKIEKVGDFSNLVKGTKGYLEIEIDCSKEWSGCRKAAVFCVGDQEYPVPIIGNKCNVPDAVTEKSIWELKLVGERDGYRIVTGKAGVIQK